MTSRHPFLLAVAWLAAACVVEREGLRVDVEIAAEGGRLEGATRVLEYPSGTWILQDAWIDVTSIRLVPCALDDIGDSGLAAVPFGPLGLLVGTAWAHVPTAAPESTPVRLDLASPTARHTTLRPPPGTYCGVDVRVVPAADPVAWRLTGSVDPAGVTIDLGGPGEALHLDLPEPVTLDAEQRTARLTLVLHVDRWLAAVQPDDGLVVPGLADEAAVVERLCEDLAEAFRVVPP